MLLNGMRSNQAVSQKALSLLSYKLKIELDSVIWPASASERGGQAFREPVCVCECVSVVTTMGVTKQR